MKARIIDQTVKVTSEPDFNSPTITELAVGSEIEIGGVRKNLGKEWVAVMLPTGQKGYLPGDVRIYHIKPAILLDKNVNLYAAPSAQSPVKTIYNKNAKLYLTDVVEQDNQKWVKVRDDSGNEGFIGAQTRIKLIPEVTKGVGQKMMLYGALWCIGGIVVTVGSYSLASSSSSGGSYFIAWGAVLFGAIQFLKGLYKFLTAPV